MLDQLSLSTGGTATTVAGIREDTLVRMADGWRFRKRVRTHDAPYG